MYVKVKAVNVVPSCIEGQRIDTTQPQDPSIKPLTVMPLLH